MQARDGRRTRVRRLHLEINLVDWIVIACVTNGLSIALALTVILLLLRR